MRKYFLILLSLLILSSCDLLEDILGDEESGLTSSEIVEGLKTALEIGTDTASTEMSASDGYYKGSPLLALIQLPDEVEMIRTAINSNSTVKLLSEQVGLDDKFDDVILAVNRAAEDAAKDVAPIFKDAIFDLSISQGLDILQGIVPTDDGKKSTYAGFDSTAATQYLKLKTFDNLVALYAPQINTSLDKDLVLNTSANEIWGSFTTNYNDLLDLINSNFLTSSLDEQLGLPSAIAANLGEFSTRVALDELFFRVGKEEKNIRKNPFKWASSIIQKVFGHVFD
ncbi:MAG: hypothetical protein A2X13_07860 [Bacteroidetes bacterium GWC2_33_15]|nr:MAG: hypothetical protein A2X10_04915 [Bacteroidetes bacterium GWA2_33_15]OFX52666.1 MAG: hypothetical protein A2X13_07860 [Bacteroidetes bacterium GWC2_33_15]OFX64028.1 MAG: hypothetical protein A2X15_02475 [Bacteroidetes bacterium GWB2_32_14]OFX67287.1 MAG: hypothetical protein A2X14_11940 [Bacteroidetes bacterium GWD2_33_33]HAN18854.1 hypothetical protein [Bacteroidales bacterium]